LALLKEFNFPFYKEKTNWIALMYG
jgi:hypothetical protein